MENYFDVMAQHPNCVMAVDATDGGKWKSSFKDGWVMPSAPSGNGSFEETHGLLTKINVEAENNYFKYITDAIGYIETPLDLRGYSGDFTMIAKTLVAKNEVAGTTRKDVLLMQGNLNYSNGSFVFFILQATTTNRYELNFYVQNSNNSTIMITYTIPNDFDWTMPHVFAVNYVATLKKFSLFIDGEIVSVFTKDTFDRFYNGVDSKNKLFYKMNNVAADIMKQYNAMIFDKALSADEIKILSDSLLPKGPTSEEPGTALLCTTPTNLTSNTSNADWECYTQSLNANSDGNTANAYLAASGGTTENTRWKNTYAAGSAGVRFVWKRTDLAEWAVKQVKIGNTLTSVMPQQIKSFTLQGSNDGTTWTDVGTLQTQSQPTFNTYTENTFSYADNTSKYKYWGILCNNVNYPEVAVSSTVAAANLIQFTNEI